MYVEKAKISDTGLKLNSWRVHGTKCPSWVWRLFGKMVT